MIEKSVSDCKAKKEVNVSCWNCLFVEDDKDDNAELTLPEIRKDYRSHFKLYSTLVSEISRPKAVPIKQKVKENYIVGKKIEKEIIKIAEKEKALESSNVEITYDDKVDVITNEDDVNSKTSTTDISEENDDDNSAVVYKIQIETSTPKPNKETKPKDCECSPFVTEEEKPKEIESIVITQNISVPRKGSPVITNDENDYPTCNLSKCESEDSSLSEQNISETSKQELESEKSFDRSTSRIPIAINKEFKCYQTTSDLHTSLPTLQRKNILKSTKSLSGDASDPEAVKPQKSLRWSTLDLPRSSRSINDEVCLSDAASPNHATLPRRSNSPLPHERDLLDRDRFSPNRSGLQARSESMASVYSGAGEGTRGNVTVRGEVQISLLYNYRLGALEVGVKRCRDLAPVDTKRNRSDPYVKVYLLPDKSKAGKRKTKVKKNTLNPVFEESLSFVQPLASLSARTLWLSVWHADMFGRNDFLGEVTLPLADVVFDDPAPMWYKLHERTIYLQTEQFDEQQGSRGDLIVALKLDLHDGARGKGTLHVLVKEAKNLVATKPNGLADVFCKSYLLPERGRLAKQKTAVCRRTLSPKWEHTFTYRGLTLQELSSRALELSLWDRDRLASNDFMGAIRLSLGTGTYMGAPVNWMDSVGKEVSLWQTMMQRPNFWVEGSFPLRPHLNN